MENLNKTLSPVWTHLTEHEIVSGEAVYLIDKYGNRFMDFTSGIGVTNTGHCHPRIVKAIQEQASKLLFGQINCVVPEKTLELSKKITELLPEPLNTVFFANSGAEATEACVKLAKQATGRTNVIVFQGSFHGRTHLTMGMTTSKTVYRHKYQPLPGGIFVAPFPNAYQYGWSEEDAIDFCIKQLDIVLKGQTAPDETAAILIEPVLGEGGYVPVPARFLQHLRKVCDDYGILLVIDEVQSGYGRTGTFFCFEQYNIIPDILIMAKGLGSGLPISGIVASHKLMSLWSPGTHGGTYGGGSAIPMASASETTDIIANEGFLKNVNERGAQLMGALKALQHTFPILGDIRGRGLMIGTEFTHPNGEPASEIAKKVLEGCLKRNLLMLMCGTYGNVIRWIPPLIVTREEIDQAIDIFTESLKEALNNKNET